VSIFPLPAGVTLASHADVLRLVTSSFPWQACLCGAAKARGSFLQ